MFALLAGMGMLYGAQWITRKAPTIAATVLPVLYFKEKQKSEAIQAKYEGLNIESMKRLSPHYDDAAELRYFKFTHSHSVFAELNGKFLLLTEEETGILGMVIEKVEAGFQSPVDLQKMLTASEFRLSDPEIAEQLRE